MRVLLWKGCVLFALLTVATGAQETPLTFEQIFEAVRLRSPALGAQRAATKVASARVQQASASPNPNLQLQTQADGFERVSLVGLAISQRIELGGKKEARVRAAEQAQVQAQWEERERLRALRLELREKFFRLLLAQEKERLAQDLLALTERHLEITKKRFESGDVARTNVRALEQEMARRQARQKVASGELARRLTSLKQHLDSTQANHLKVSGKLGWPSDIPDAELLLEKALSRSRLGLASARSTTKKRLHELAQRQAVSDLTLQAGVLMQRDVFPAKAFRPAGQLSRLDDTGPILQLQLQIPLPIFDDNSGNIEAALAQHEQAVLEARALQEKMRGEIKGLHQLLSAQRQARLILDNQAVPEAKRTLETIEQAYKLGFRSQLDLLLTRENYLRTREEALQAVFDESMTLAALEASVGCPLPLEEKDL